MTFVLTLRRRYNQITTDGTYDYAYDADGNLITQTTIATGATTNYTWDYRNRLTEITYKNSSGTITEQIEYTYDAFNRRISQSIDPTGGGDFTEVTYYVYDSNGNLLMTLNNSGAVTHTYLNGPGANQVLTDDAGSGNVSWLLADQQGTVRNVINSSGTVLDHLTYDAYGNILSQSNSTNQPSFAFAGMQLDSTGLYYDNARYYNPATGAFLSQDPSGSAGSGSNLYDYVNGDPVNLVDPTGLSPKEPQLPTWLANAVNWVNNFHFLIGNQNTFTGSQTLDTWAAEFTQWYNGAMAEFAREHPFLNGVLIGVTLGLQMEAVIDTGGLAAGLASDGIEGIIARLAEEDLAGSATAAAESEPITQSIGDLRSAGLKDAHHVIQDAAVRDLPGYDTNAAPGVQLEGPSTSVGSPHYEATQVQRAAGGGTYGAERTIAYNALRAAGYSDAEATQALQEADQYFNSIGVNESTPTGIPGNRH